MSHTIVKRIKELWLELCVVVFVKVLRYVLLNTYSTVR